MLYLAFYSCQKEKFKRPYMNRGVVALPKDYEQSAIKCILCQTIHFHLIADNQIMMRDKNWGIYYCTQYIRTTKR